MIKTHISVTVGMTHNLGNYSNFRPEVQMSAQIVPGEDAENCARKLLDEALELCYDQIDRVLEDDGDPAKYSPEPRYTAYVCQDEKIVVIAADEKVRQDEALKERLKRYSEQYDLRGHRERQLFHLVNKRFPEPWRIIDADTEGLDGIPELDALFMLRLGELLIVGYGRDEGDLPEAVKRLSTERHIYTRSLRSLIDSVEAPGNIVFLWEPTDERRQRLMALSDVQSAVEQWNAQQAQQEEIKDIPFDDYGDDEDDDDDYDDDDDEDDDE